MQILIDIKNKIATAADDYKIVCGNSDYTVKFTFDEEWDEHTIKTARFSYVQGGVKKFIDVIFDGAECFAPILSNTLAVEIGVFAGDLQTTTPCLLACEKSILCEKGLPDAPAPNVYNQIIEMCEETEAIAKSVEDRANNGEFNGKPGKDGKDGKTPERGVDYWTEEDKAEIKSYVDDAILGGAW